MLQEGKLHPFIRVIMSAALSKGGQKSFEYLELCILVSRLS